MSKVTFTKVFARDLIALKNRHNSNYRKANTVLMEISLGQPPSVERRDETRIPKAVKFELDRDYRLLLQRVEGEDTFIALSAGNHDHVESFLDAHKGWVFDPNTKNIRELRVATAPEEATPVVVSQGLKAERRPIDAAQPSTEPLVFSDFTPEMFSRLGIPDCFVVRLKEVTNPDDLEVVSLLGEIEDSNQIAAGLLLAYITGDTASRQDILKIARGEAEFRTALNTQEIRDAEQNTDEIVGYSDPAELEGVLDRGSFEQWQLFLHPDQKALVTRRFAGPARIRGLSGSGKTVVGLHRAKYLAQRLAGTNRYVLYTTFNKALARSASSLLDSLCGPERSKIEVTHLHRWCLDFIEFRDMPRPRSTPDAVDNAQHEALSSLPSELRMSLKTLPAEYIWEEIEFIYGRFMHEEVGGYLATDRAGRGRAITETQRAAFLQLYRNYIDALKNARCVDFPEFVRIAFRLLANGEQPERDYASVIVDEVQDISEIGLKLLHMLAGNVADGLVLIGDGTQRIYTRGYSLRGLGIEVSGRALVLTKNYRNTQEILQAAFPLVEDQWASEVKSADMTSQYCRPEFSSRRGPKPAIVKCATVEQEAEFLQREIGYLLQFERYQADSICVMARDRAHRQMALDACKSAGLPAYLYKVEKVEEEPMTQPDQDGIRISSLHSAKGHEYAAVKIVGCVEGVLPLKSATEAEDEPTERALLYVGMTRARDILYLSYSESGAGHPQKPSPFLSLIQDKCDQMRFHARAGA